MRADAKFQDSGKILAFKDNKNESRDTHCLGHEMSVRSGGCVSAALNQSFLDDLANHDQAIRQAENQL